VLIYDTIQAQCTHTTYQFMHSTHIQQTAKLFTIINKAGHRPFRVPRVDQTRTRSRTTSAQIDPRPATLSAVHSNSTMHSTTARSYTCWGVLHLLGGPTPGGVVLPSLGGPIVAIQTDPHPATLSCIQQQHNALHHCTVLHLLGGPTPARGSSYTHQGVLLHLLGGPTLTRGSSYTC